MWHEAREVERRAGEQNNGKWTNIVIHLVKAYIYGLTIFRVSINNAILSYYKRYVQVDTQSVAVFVFLCASFGIVFLLSRIHRNGVKSRKMKERTPTKSNNEPMIPLIETFLHGALRAITFFLLWPLCFRLVFAIHRNQENARESPRGLAILHICVRAMQMLISQSLNLMHGVSFSRWWCQIFGYYFNGLLSFPSTVER